MPRPHIIYLMADQLRFDVLGAYGDEQCATPMLDLLAERGLQATFFVCGQGNRLHPAQRADTPEGRSLLERAKAEGHWIGNHHEVSRRR